MKSATLPSFWSQYRELNESVRVAARKAMGAKPVSSLITLQMHQQQRGNLVGASDPQPSRSGNNGR